MPTNRLKFAAPYAAETPIGAALLQVTNALFGGPGPGELAAARAKAEASRLDGELKQRKLTGQDKLAGIVETATGFGKYAPGNARDANDPHWETNAASAADFYRRYPGELAAAALRSGVNVEEAAKGRVLATSSPYFNDAARSDAAVGAGQKLRPFDAFSEAGQFKAENRDIAGRARVSAAGAAAANPDKYFKVGLQRDIVGNDRQGLAARRIAGVDPAITADIQNRREVARITGLPENDIAAYEVAQKVAGNYKSPFGSGIDSAAFAKDHPDLASAYNRVLTGIARAQNSPRVNGQRPSPDGNGWTIPSPISGAPVPVTREADGKWYFRDVDGQVKRIDSPDF